MVKYMKLYMQPDGGLGNRISEIVWACDFARAYPEVEPVIIWDNREDLAADFYDIFEKPGFEVINQRFAWGGGAAAQLKRGSLSGFIAKLREAFVYNRRKKKLSANEWPDPDYVSEDSYEPLSPQEYVKKHNIALDRDGYIYRALFFENFKGYTKDVQFKKELIESAKQQLQGKTNVIGVHIRRGDSDLCIANNPLEIWEKRMAAELEADPDTCFYIATDDLNVLEGMKAKFPGKIMSHTSANRTRDSKEGILIAVEEIIILASCRLILGSAGSSFSRIAQFHHNTLCEYYNKDTHCWEERE